MFEHVERQCVIFRHNNTQGQLVFPRKEVHAPHWPLPARHVLALRVQFVVVLVVGELEELIAVEPEEIDHACFILLLIG